MIRDDANPRFDALWPGVAPIQPPVPARRRVRVFGLTFLLLATIALIFSFARPAEYRASARLRIDMPTQGDTPDERRDAGRAAFLTEVEILTSRPLIARALDRLAAQGVALPAESAEPADEYARRLEAVPVTGTSVVQLAATGAEADVLAPLLNTLIDVYRGQLAERHRAVSGDEAVRAQEEADELAARVGDKRRALDEFRARHDIVSLERDENRALAQVKGVGQSLNAANDRLVAAEAKLRSLRETIEAGRWAPRSRDNPTLAGVEQRASALREELREMERSYTPDFLAFDPRAKALRVRLASLEEQAKEVREGGQRVALADAEEEVAAARAAVDRLTEQAGGNRQAVQAFTARLDEFKAMQEELTGLEALHRTAVERTTALQAAGQVRVPQVTTLEAAFAPQEPWRPQYARDAGIGLAASLVLALLATWIVELFNRTGPQPSLVVAPAWLPGLPTPPARSPAALGRSAPSALLPGAATLPRELDDDEIALLLDELRDEPRVVALGLLSGLSLDELAKLDWAAVDLDSDRIVLPDRRIAIAAAFRYALLHQRERNPQAGGAGGLVVPAAAAPDTLEATFLYAAHDADIRLAAEITPAALRHTCIAHLVRQGVRFSDLFSLVGRLPADQLGAYAALSPEGRKRAIADVDPIHPALRLAADPSLRTSDDSTG